MTQLEVVMWQWRDGSVHAEMQLAHFAIEGPVLTHLKGERLRTACGVDFFGRASGTGLGNPAKVDCKECRSLLVGTRAVLVKEVC